MRRMFLFCSAAEGEPRSGCRLRHAVAVEEIGNPTPVMVEDGGNRRGAERLLERGIPKPIVPTMTVDDTPEAAHDAAQT